MKIEENCYYHIYNRGNNKGLIFFNPDNYTYFLNQFKKYVVPFAEVYAYCLMSNHFHIFLKVIDKINFEKGIKNFFISYTKSINQNQNRVGSLFQGRYKSKRIDSESYLTRTITYIHQNPLRAGLIKNLKDYEYSSYNIYLSDQDTFLNKTEAINWFKDIQGFIEDHQA